MEPCKGGTLTNLPEEALQILKDYDPQATPASLAFRFAASQPGVVRVLSGMNSMEQVKENTALFKNFKPITEEELKVIAKIREVIERNTPIPCTGALTVRTAAPKTLPYRSILRFITALPRSPEAFQATAATTTTSV